MVSPGNGRGMGLAPPTNAAAFPNVGFAVRRAGEVAQQEHDLEAAHEIDEREASAAAAAPDTPDELDERLDKGSF